MAKKKKSGRRSAPGSSRPDRAAELIRQEISQLLARQTIKDPRVSGAMVTVTDVRMSPDLYYASVYVSVLDEDAAGRERALAGLRSAAGVVRRELGAVLSFRSTPEVRFFLDESIAYGAKIEGILKEIERERQPDPQVAEPPEEPREDG